MNILFLYPKYPVTFWSFKYILPYIGKKAAYPPLGLLTIASLLPKEWNKKLIDTNFSPLTDKDIDWADMVFISGMIVQKEHAQILIDWCKQHNKIVVAGGPLFTTQHENFRNVDYFILGEAEITLLLFLKDFSKGRAKHFYISNEHPDITKTPAPMWSLINPHHYAAMCIQYSRGCPFNCEFCDIIIMNGRIPRSKTSEQVLQELQAIYVTGWRGSVFIVDDNFIGNQKKVKELLVNIIKWQKQHNYPFVFFTEASINLADDSELMKLMIKANFSMVFLGIETPEENSLKAIGKFQNINRNLNEAIRIIHNHGLMVMGGFIVGFDQDNENIFERQIRFIQQTGIAVAMVGILTALPKTRLWQRLKSENRLLEESTGDNTLASLNFEPKMGSKNLIRGYAQLLSHIYAPKNYYRRIHTFLKDYHSRIRNNNRKVDFKAFFKCLWYIGVRSKQKRYFWKLFFSTIIKRQDLAVAIKLAIYGVHFRKVAEKNMFEMQKQGI